MGDLTDHFSREEFACKCGCGADKVSKELVEKLELVRLMYGKPMRVTSGVRCAFHNQGEGGKKTSAHLQGEAADIAVKDCSERDLLVGFLRTQFLRMGVAKSFIHVDIQKHKPAPCLWVY